MTASLKRMGALGATVFVAGNMIGSGVYLLPATLGAYGSITLVSWGVAAAGALVLGLVFGLLGMVRPTGDGAVAYAAEGLAPVFGHISWFAYWLTAWVGTPAVAVAATGYLAFFFPVLRQPALGVACSLALIWLAVFACWLGPRVLARLSGGTLLIGLLPIAIAIGVGAVAFDPGLFAASWNVSGTPDITAATAAVVPIFWAFLGLETANMVAAVVGNPRRNLPIAAVGGVALAAMVYIAASAALMGLKPASALAVSTAPFAEAIAPVAGAVTAALVAACACAKAFGALSGWVMVGAETGRAAAVSGYLPRFVSELSPDRKPLRDLIVVGLLMSAVILVTVSPTLGRQFMVLINISVILSMVQYLLCSAALVKLGGDAPSPALKLTARIAAVAGTVFSAWVISTMDPALRLPSLAMLAASLGLYGLHLLAKRRRLA